MLDKVDIIVGSFSKTFAANGGFIAVKTKAAAEYLKYYSATQTFSNALSPVQAAAVLAAFEHRPLGGRQERRQGLMNNILYLREEAKRWAWKSSATRRRSCRSASARKGLARIASRNMAELGAIANLVEYPPFPRAARASASR